MEREPAAGEGRGARRAGRWRRFVVRPFVWLLVVLALAVLGLRLFLASDLARVRARDLLEARLADALGRPVAIARVEFELLPTRLVVFGLEIASDRAGEAPLVRLERGEVEIGLEALRREVVDLRRADLRGLEVELRFREDGTDNLPRPPRRGGRSRFEVRFGTLTVEPAIVVVDEERLPFALRAGAGSLRLTGTGGEELDGALVAEAVRLRLPEADPFEVAVGARVRLGRDRLRILSARLDHPELAARASGELRWARGTRLALDVRAVSSGALLDEIGWLDGQIEGAFDFAGEVALAGTAWEVTGRLASPRLEIVDFALDDIAGRVRVDPRRARFEIERGRFGGGALAGTAAFGLVRPFPAELDLAIEGAALDAALDRFGVPVRGVRGRLSGPFAYRFDLLDAERGSGEGVLAIESDGAPASGELGIRLDGGAVELDPLRWHAAGQTVEGRGDYDLSSGRGRFDLEVASEDLGELAGRLEFFEPGELWLPTDGTARMTVALELAGERYAAAVGFEAAAIEAPGLRAARAAGLLRADPSRLAIERLDLVHAGGGTVRLAGVVPLADPARGAAPALAVELAADGWPVEEAGPWLPFELPLAGRARGSLVLGGSLERLEGRADVVVAPAEIAGVEARRLAARFDWDAEALRVESARVDLDAGGIEGEGSLDLARERLDFRLSSPALALESEPLSLVGRGALAGTLRLDATIGGTLDRPAVAVSARARGATLAGEPLPGEGDLLVELDWRSEQLDAELVLPGVARLAGGGRLELGGESRLRFELATDELASLVTLAAGGDVLALEGGLRAAIDLELSPEGVLAADLRAPSLAFRWQGREIRTLEPVLATYRDGTLRLESLYLSLGGEEEELFVGGRVVFTGEDAPRLDLHLQADADASWAEPFLGGLEISGRLSMLADLRGPLEAPEWSGQGEWSDGRFIPPSIPDSVERARALVLLYPGALVLDELEGELGGGTLAASGRLSFAGAGPPSYRFEAAARRIALRWPPGWQVRGDADLTLSSTSEGRQVAGQIVLDRAYYLQDIEISLAQLLQRLLARSRVAVQETDEVLASTALNVALSAPGTMRVRNNLAELEATADLAIRGSLARPVVFGEVRAEPDGQVTYGGNTYVVERGVLTFANPIRIDPYLDIVATTRIQDYAVLLNVSGAMSRPLTAFSSDPPLPDLEILGLLTTGAPLESPVFTNVAPTGGETSRSVAAEAVLYGQAASLVTQRVGKLFGIDRVRVEPLTSGDTVGAARVTVGKRLSSDVFVTYSYDPSSTAQDIFTVEWRVSPQLMLVLTQNGDESYALDTRWEKRF